MREGKNREIRNVLGHLGLAVNRLIRVSYGPFQLGDLPDGAVEEVKTRALREQLGERIAAVAGADFSGPLVERDEPVVKAPPRPPEVRAPEPDARRDREQAPRAAKPGGRRGAPDRSPQEIGPPVAEVRIAARPDDNAPAARAGPRRAGRTGRRAPMAKESRRGAMTAETPPRRGGGRPYKGRRDR